MNNSAALRQYCKELKKALQISPKAKKLLLHSVETDITEYMEDFPNHLRRHAHQACLRFCEAKEYIIYFSEREK